MATEIYLGYPPENIVKWIKENYKPNTPSVNTYLTFKAKENDSCIKYTGNAEGTSNLEYCIDNGEFQDYQNGDIITIQLDQTISFRAIAAGNETFGGKFITPTGSFDVYGNIMSLLKQDMDIDVVPSHCFEGIFSTDKYADDSVVCNIIDASKLLLPAKTVESDGYRAMFYGNTALIKAPELPATSIERGAYRNMFDGCENLETPPSILPVETLAETCYYQMFQNCTNLKTIPDIKATTLGASCCGLMFNGCSSLGDLSEFTLKAEYPPESDGNVHCYQAMFYNSGVTHSPNILLKSIISNNFNGMKEGTVAFMFAGCKNLKAAYFPNIIENYTVTYADTFAEAASNIELHLRDGIKYINN